MLTRAIKVKQVVCQIYFDESTPITPYTEFFLDNFPDTQGKTVLDFGCGNGIYAVVSCLQGAQSVTALDIRKETGVLVKQNKEHNSCHKIVFADKVTQKQNFDIILCNPASLPNIESKLPQYMDGGPLGNKMIVDLIDLTRKSLNKDGVLYFLHTTLVPQSLTQRYINDLGMKFEIINSIKFPFRESYYRIFDLILVNKKQYDDIYFEIENGIHIEQVNLYKVTL